MTEFEAIAHQVRKAKYRFMARLIRNLEPDGECLLWTRSVTKNGYGRINIATPGNGHMRLYVHRVFLILKLKRPIAKGMEAGHFHCNNTRCVVHVREETHTDNMKDCNGRRWGKKGDR